MAKQHCDDHRPIQHRDGKPPWCHQCGLTQGYAIPRSRFETEEESVPEPKEETESVHFDENTLRKVYEGLLKAGIFGQQAVDAVSQIQNQGILFREKKPKRRGRPPRKEVESPKNPDGPTEINQTQEEIDAAWKPKGDENAESAAS